VPYLEALDRFLRRLLGVKESVFNERRAGSQDHLPGP
jgi:hypothetical protein